MSPRTSTLPPHEPSMWRRLLARAHPDTGGDHELFVWTNHVRELVCDNDVSSRRRAYSSPPRSAQNATRAYARSESERVPFDYSLNFGALTIRAIEVGESVGEPYATLLRLLADCEPVYDGTLAAQQDRGATYKQLAAIGHRTGMSKQQRTRWYRVAEEIPLSQRHAGHIMGRLGREAAA